MYIGIAQRIVQGAQRGAGHYACVTGNDVTGSGTDRNEVTWSHVTGSDVITGSMICACPEVHHAFFSYYSSSTKCSNVVQVPWLPEVTEGHVNPLGFPWVCACTTGSCAISSLVWWFWSYSCRRHWPLGRTRLDFVVIWFSDWRDSVNISLDKINPCVVFPSYVQTCIGPSMLSGTWILCYWLLSYLDVPVYHCTTWLPC